MTKSHIYYVKISGKLDELIDTEINELGNWNSATEMFVQGLVSVHNEAKINGLIK